MSVENAKGRKTIEKRIKSKIIYCVCLIVLGVMSLVIGAGNIVPVKIPDYNSGFYAGVGSALIAGAIVMIIKQVRILKNPEKLKEMEIYENDERIKMIGLKAWSYTGYAMYIVLFVGMLIAAFISEVVLSTISVIIGVYALCLIISSIYCKKTM